MVKLTFYLSGKRWFICNPNFLNEAPITTKAKQNEATAEITRNDIIFDFRVDLYIVYANFKTLKISHLTSRIWMLFFYSFLQNTCYDSWTPPSKAVTILKCLYFENITCNKSVDYRVCYKSQLSKFCRSFDDHPGAAVVSLCFAEIVTKRNINLQCSSNMDVAHTHPCSVRIQNCTRCKIRNFPLPSRQHILEKSVQQ